MKNYILVCTVSALIGGLVAAWAIDAYRGSQRVGGQEAREEVAAPRPGKQPPSSASAGDPSSQPESVPSIPDAAAAARAELPDGLTREELVNIAVYEAVNRGVVHITTRSVTRDSLLMLEVPAEGSGSGSILDRQGHVLTNWHVVDGAREITVTLHSGESYPAGLIGKDPSNDMAVLKIDAPEDSLHPLRLGDSSQLRVGQKIYAVGNPFGLERTLTVGIISSLNRMLEARNGRSMKSIIQIDAALNRGNSGGPLLDSQARLIGMNTAIASSTGENTGVGFAIPVATIRRVVPQLIENGRVIRPSIGITRVYRTERGLGIASVVEGGPADEAGLRGFRIVRERKRRGPYIYETTRIDRSQADTILAVDGKPIRSVDDLLTVIEQRQPGDQVRVTVWREGGEVEVAVRLVEDEE